MDSVSWLICDSLGAAGKNIRGQVFDTLLTGADRLAVDIPGFFPKLGRDFGINFVLSHFVTKLGFEDL